MANVDGDSPNFDELRALGEEPAAEGEAAPTDETAAEPLAEEAAAAPPAAETTPPEGEPAEAAEAEKPAEGIEKEEEEEEEEPSKLPLYLEIAALIFVPLILLAMASKDLGLANWDVLSIWTALYLIGLGLISYALWKSRATSTLFTVFLGCVLAAMLTGVYCLWIELGRYQYDINAQEAKRKVGMVLPAEPGLRALFPLPGGSGGISTVV